VTPVRHIGCMHTFRLHYSGTIFLSIGAIKYEIKMHINLIRNSCYCRTHCSTVYFLNTLLREEKSLIIDFYLSIEERRKETKSNMARCILLFVVTTRPSSHFCKPSPLLRFYHIITSIMLSFVYLKMFCFVFRFFQNKLWPPI
jgi:hypothetical protein